MSAVVNVGINVDSRGASQKLRALDSQARKTESAFAKLSAGVTKLAGAFALFSTSRFIFAKTAELEKQTKGLEVLTGSAQKATEIIKELQEVGRVTPFTSAELIESAKRLNAFGVETEKVVETTRRLADVSGASGAELSGIVTAYGQVIAKGRLQGEELLQFQERGVALQGELRKMYKLSGEEFQNALSKGRISAEAVEVAIKNLTDAGGKYADGAIAQSETLSGKFSTLQDNIEQTARTIGQVLSPVIKGIFDQAIQALDAVNRLILAGRGGGFTRAVGAIGTSITFGATSEAVDRAEKLLTQISSQKNKVGIEQNLQAIEQLSKALTRIRPEDVNAQKAVELQGKILQLRAANLKALEQMPASRTAKTIEVPELLGGNGKAKGGRGRTAAKERLDMSEAMYALELKRQSLAFSSNEFLKIEVDRQIEIQRIMERNLLPRERAIALQDAQNNAIKRGAELFKGFAKDVEALQDGATKAGKAFAQLFIDADNKVLEQKSQVVKQLWEGAASAVASTFDSAIDAAVTGTENLGQALQKLGADLLKTIGKMLIMYGIGQALGALGGGSENPQGVFSFLARGFGFRANGGPVDQNKPYVVGERGPELFVPGRSGSVTNNEQLSSAMNRYRRAPSGGGAAGSDSMQTAAGGAAVADKPIDVRYTVERINNVDYVTADQFQAGMRQATQQGAAQGESRALAKLRNSPGTRRRIGL